MQLLKKCKQKQTETDAYYFETKIEVFHKHKTMKHSIALANATERLIG